ncbi:Glycosyl transferase family 2 [Clostridium cavendishii DSM 21758]|uniref:Glycosyl transferase family 2 n=1 Tax=Clostridium cavendishii DSM 21758 TaxID=1121302 RepID=A0A1M6IYS3_9CLOT|nr:glycosyltransferase family 2 protein [Clostridium cavendishii]SHJ39611.1 Glycosyl transferase family 2 [Clostridium cavendishii DSM 21758]
MNKKPLVSILIPNYNYGHYLENCIESAFNQTYPNIEIIFQDNNSTDNSYDIALKYEKKYRGTHRYFSVGKNKRNLGSDINSNICRERSEGKYLMYLSSDDAIKPTCIERCVEIMEKYNNVGMVMTHRDEIYENGVSTKTPSFYNKSCIIPGEEQAAVFMMAGIAVPSQLLLRRSTMDLLIKRRTTAFQVAGDWYNNFLMACCGDVAYINEALCYYRVHTGSETSESEENLLGIFEHYQLINCFKNTAESFNLKKPLERYEEAVKKLGSMCLRYTVKMLKANKIDSAKKYLYIAPVFDESIINNKIYIDLKECLELDMKELKNKLEKISTLTRKISYEPPEGSEIIEMYTVK